MTHDDDDRTTFLFYAPGREPHAWALDLAGLGEALRESFPEVHYKVRQDRTHQGEPYLSSGRAPTTAPSTTAPPPSTGGTV
ncbi:hypothetical protein AB6O49_26775 [Streptomyces sp. SBR177]